MTQSQLITKPIIFTNATIIDPQHPRAGKRCLRVDEGIITHIAADIKDLPEHCVHEEQIDCGEKIICPSFVDLRSFNADEKAAEVSGFGHILLNSYAHNAFDSPEALMIHKMQQNDKSAIRYHYLASATKAMQGVDMTELGLMKDQGAKAIGDSFHSPSSTALTLKIMRYAKHFNVPYISFGQDYALTEGTCAHDGDIASRLGLSASPRVSETLQISRDIELAKHSGCRLHIALVTSKDSIAIIEQAQKNGLPVTAGTAAHYLYYNHIALENFDSRGKLMPPLRHEDDRLALIEAVKNGIITCLVSDHQPCHMDEKHKPFDDAAFGASGYESLLPLVASLCTHAGLSWETAIQALTYNPAQILGIDAGHITTGSAADFIIIDPNKPWTLTEKTIQSTGKNTVQSRILAQGKLWARYSARRQTGPNYTVYT